MMVKCLDSSDFFDVLEKRFKKNSSIDTEFMMSVPPLLSNLQRAGSSQHLRRSLSESIKCPLIPPKEEEAHEQIFKTIKEIWLLISKLISEINNYQMAAELHSRNFKSAVKHPSNFKPAFKRQLTLMQDELNSLQSHIQKFLKNSEQIIKPLDPHE